MHVDRHQSISHQQAGQQLGRCRPGNRTEQHHQSANSARIAFGEMRYWLTDLAVSLLTPSETNAAAARARMDSYLDQLALRKPKLVAAVRAEQIEFEKSANEAVDRYTDDQRVEQHELSRAGRRVRRDRHEPLARSRAQRVRRVTDGHERIARDRVRQPLDAVDTSGRSGRRSAAAPASARRRRHRGRRRPSAGRCGRRRRARPRRRRARARWLLVGRPVGPVMDVVELAHGGVPARARHRSTPRPPLACRAGRSPPRRLYIDSRQDQKSSSGALGSRTSTRPRQAAVGRHGSDRSRGPVRASGRAGARRRRRSPAPAAGTSPAIFAPSSSTAMPARTTPPGASTRSGTSSVRVTAASAGRGRARAPSRAPADSPRRRGA